MRYLGGHEGAVAPVCRRLRRSACRTVQTHSHLMVALRLHQGLEPRCEEAMIGCFTRVRRLGRDRETLSAAQRHTTHRCSF